MNLNENKNPLNPEPPMSMEERSAMKEIKDIKQDDTREYPKIEPKFIWDTDIRHDRTDGWD